MSIIEFANKGKDAPLEKTRMHRVYVFLYIRHNISVFTLVYRVFINSVAHKTAFLLVGVAGG